MLGAFVPSISMVAGLKLSTTRHVDHFYLLDECLLQGGSTHFHASNSIGSF